MFMVMAFRNVIRNRRRSGFTVLAMSFGLCCLIIFQALKSGLHYEMVNSAITIDAGTMQIHAAGYQNYSADIKPLADIDQINAVLKQSGIERFSHRLKTQALLLAARKSSSVLLSGVNPVTEAKITFIQDKLVAGEYLTEKNHILLSERLAESLHLNIGEPLTVMLQKLDGLPMNYTFTVGGFYRTALASFDRSHVYVPIDTLNTVIGSQSNTFIVTEIVCLTALEQTKELVKQLKLKLTDDNYEIDPWQILSPDVVQLIELNDATMGVLIVIVFVIVAMGIANTITVILYERFYELGIMSAIGTSPVEIMTIILLESFFLGLIGALLGTLMGTSACMYLGHFGVDLTAMISTNQYFANSHILKSDLQLNDLLTANILVLFTTISASIYPAWKAAYLKPVQAISSI